MFVFEQEPENTSPSPSVQNDANLISTACDDNILCRPGLREFLNYDETVQTRQYAIQEGSWTYWSGNGQKIGAYDRASMDLQPRLANQNLNLDVPLFSTISENLKNLRKLSEEFRTYNEAARGAVQKKVMRIIERRDVQYCYSTSECI